MTGIPTFLASGTVVIKRTPNGFAVCENAGAPVETCPVFETWDALVYYLGVHFATPSA